MKRFYREVSVTANEAGGFAIALDGRPVRTPGKRPLVVPGRDLAEAIAAEWRDQADVIDPAAMPIGRLANSALDHVAPRRAETIAEVARYAATDLVCYRADNPASLAERQQAQWHPLVEWTEEMFGARLAVTAGLIPAAQTEDALERLRAAVAALDDFPLTGLHAVTASCGSVVLGLATLHARIDGPTACELSLLDETYQAELWGDDAEAAARRERLKRDIVAAAAFLAMCGGAP